MYIVIYRPHNELNLNTQYFGPFTSDEDAYDFLCTLPALGIHQPSTNMDNPGVKYTQRLVSPESQWPTVPYVTYAATN